MSKNVINIGGRDVSVRPLTLRQIQDMAEDIDAGGRCGPKATKEEISAYVRVVKTCLAGDDVGMSEDDLLDLIDLGDVGRVWSHLMGLSGFVRRVGEE